MLLSQPESRFGLMFVTHWVENPMTEFITSSHQPHVAQSCAAGFWWDFLCPAEASGLANPWRPTPSPTCEDESQPPAKILSWGGGGGKGPPAPAKVKNIYTCYSPSTSFLKCRDTWSVVFSGKLGYSKCSISSLVFFVFSTESGINKIKYILKIYFEWKY